MWSALQLSPQSMRIAPPDLVHHDLGVCFLICPVQLATSLIHILRASGVFLVYVVNPMNPKIVSRGRARFSQSYGIEKGKCNI